MKADTRMSSTVCIVALAVGCVIAATPALAELPPEDPDPAPKAQSVPKLATVEAFSGSLRHAIATEAPPFHGLEPRLGLSYVSGRGDGLAGVGWSLDGFSTIERGTPNHGAPRFDADDVFYLDGTDLLPCDLPTVDCITGGTHTPRYESFERIVHEENGPLDRWIVTSKNGTRREYEPIFEVSGPNGRGGVYRWGLARVVDLYGNEAEYAWSCSSQECYPDTVAYGPYLVVIGYEMRSDLRQFATGGEEPGVTAFKPISIAVLAEGSLVRGYRLRYQESPVTHRSTLMGVQQVGSDAQLRDGRLIGGTALPEQTFALSDENTTENATFDDAEPWGEFSLYYHSNAHYTGDFDGDQRQDMLYVPGGFGSPAAWMVMRSNGDGFEQPEPWAPLGELRSWTSVWTQDVDRDGNDDLVYEDTSGFVVLRSSGVSPSACVGDPACSGGFLPGEIWAPPAFGSRHAWLRDMDGDMYPDLVFSSYAGVFVALNLQTSFGAAELWLAEDISIYDDTFKGTWLDDFNGDGRTDLMFVKPESDPFAPAHFWVYVSAGDAFAAGERWAEYYLPRHHSDYRVADFTGDGKADLSLVDGDWSVFVFASAGNSFDSPRFWGALPTLAHHTFSLWTQDVSGDGRADVIYEHDDFYWVMRGRSSFLGAAGGGFEDAEVWAQRNTLRPHLALVWLQDFTGDGRPDLVDVSTDDYFAPYRYFVAPSSTAGDVDLLHVVRNGLGAETEVSYAPSTRWNNDGAVPLSFTVVQSVLRDGAGGAALTTWSYDGGRFDATERRPLGFRHVRQTSPCIADEPACPTSDTYYRQDLAAAGNPERIELRDSSGVLLKESTSEFQTSGDALPRFALETAGSVIDHGAATTRTTRNERVFDDFGNVLSEISFGFTDSATDDSRVETSYVSNFDIYLVGLPSEQRSYSADGVLLAATRYAYDGASWGETPVRGGNTTIERWLDQGDRWISAHREFNAVGNVVVERDALGRAIATGYDAFDLFVVSRTDALGNSVETTWSIQCGKPEAMTDVNGQITLHEYDALCRNVSIETPLGGYTTTKHLDLGTAAQRVRIEQPGPDNSVLFEERTFNGLGQVTRIERTGASGPVVETMTYNARGQIASRTAPHQAGESIRSMGYEYDSLDRSTRIVMQDGSATTHAYAPGVVVRTDPGGHVERITRDGRGSVIEVARSHGDRFVVERYEADALGRVVAIEDPQGARFHYQYDSLGRLLAEDDPDRGVRSGEWDDAGQLVTRVDALGQRTETVYDELGRKLSETSRAGTAGAETSTWDYDSYAVLPSGEPASNLGRLTTAIGPTGVVDTYDYDAEGRVVRQTRTVGDTTFTFLQRFDEGGRLLERHLPDGDVASYRYDAAGRVSAIDGILSSASYDATGALRAVTNENGTASRYEHSPSRNFLVAIRTTHGPKLLQDLTYQRDVEGRVTSVASPFAHEGWSYEYDDLHRLRSSHSATSASDSQAFTWDDAGNLMSQTDVGCSTYGASGRLPHAIVAAGDRAYEYDGNGNMTSRAGIAVEFDGRERMRRIGDDVFTYDADGDRLSSTQGGVTTLVVAPDYELTDGTVTKYFSLGKHLVAKRVGAETFWLHVDALGSIQVVTNDQGLQVQRHSYRPFGDEIATLTEHEDNRTWIGEHADASGLLFLNARYYDPQVGRFISPDPSLAGQPGVGLNRYAYGEGDPVNRLDPSGLSWEVPQPLFNGIVGFGDGLLFGAGGLIRDLLGISGPDTDSAAYIAGDLLTNVIPARAGAKVAGGLATRAAREISAGERAVVARIRPDEIQRTFPARARNSASSERADGWVDMTGDKINTALLPKGMTGVVIHGSEDGQFLKTIFKDGPKMHVDIDEAAAQFVRQTNYTGGPVCLASCFAGSSGSAQAFANALGRTEGLVSPVSVWASGAKVGITEGKFYRASGQITPSRFGSLSRFQEFKPK